MAAVRSAAVVRGPAFDALLLPPTHASIAPADDPALMRAAYAATHVAFVTLGGLQRLPGWRNTCLYRAVAECLVLRALGMPATLRLGVARTATATTGRLTADESVSGTMGPGAIAAHAWVDCPGHRCRTADAGGADGFVALDAHSPPVPNAAAAKPRPGPEERPAHAIPRP